MQRVCTFTEPVGTVKFIHTNFLYYYSTYLTEKVNGTWLSDNLETFRSPPSSSEQNSLESVNTEISKSEKSKIGKSKISITHFASHNRRLVYS